MVDLIVNKFPKTLEELRLRRKAESSEESLFFLVDDLSNDWFVWHSVEWEEGSPLKSGEADFLIFNENYGMVIIEVKGGIISFKNNIYFTTRRDTGEKIKIQDPFHQAKKSMYYFINEYIREAYKGDVTELLVRSRNSFKFPLKFNSGVYFPDTYFKKYNRSNIQIIKNKIFDKEDYDHHMSWRRNSDKNKGVSPLEKFLINLFNDIPGDIRIKPKVKKFFMDLISQDIDPDAIKSNFIKMREDELKKIILEQEKILNLFIEKPQCIFKGSAGSGKTYMAMKKAVMNFNTEKTTLFLCFNKELREFIKEYLDERLGSLNPNWNEKIQVFSLLQFLTHIIKQILNQKTSTEFLNQILDFKYKEVAKKIEKTLPTSEYLKKSKFDSIIIDEAQDIDKSVGYLFKYFLKDPIDSIYYIFYDDQQALFAKNFSINQFGIDEKDTYVLHTNVRNSKRIVDWLINKTELGEYRDFSIIEGFKIQEKIFRDKKTLLNYIVREIALKYLNYDLEPERIGILSYNVMDRIFLKCLKDDRGIYKPIKIKDEKFKLICFANPNLMKEIGFYRSKVNTNWVILHKTISAFKGLEKDVVFLLVPLLKKFKKERPELYDDLIKQIYVGASRARFVLYFVEYDFPKENSYK